MCRGAPSIRVPPAAVRSRSLLAREAPLRRSDSSSTRAGAIELPEVCEVRTEEPAFGLFQRLGRNDASGESDRGRVGEIHAAQLVARRVQMRFHAAKGEA
jgi:hypothetical protein